MRSTLCRLRRCVLRASLWWCCSTAAASPLTLASTYHAQLDLQQYWVSEKYDGIRAHWDGERLRSRSGLPIDAPAWFTAHWPRTQLDGELWAGRGQFQRVQSIVQQAGAADHDWQQLRYMVFDLPSHPGNFVQRQVHLRSLVAQLQQAWVVAAPQWQVDSHEALQRQLQRWSREGAEGLMLRHALSPYRPGRSEDLIKLKLFEDAEATVMAHLPGKGKYRGMTGALLVQMPSGQRFKIGSGLTDHDRRHPPAIGSTITYRYQGLHPSGVPRFARFWRQRLEENTKKELPASD